MRNIERYLCLKQDGSVKKCASDKLNKIKLAEMTAQFKNRKDSGS